MSFKIDLHCHSRCSDGTLTPKELLLLAKKVKLNGLSITDHDTIDAYTEDLFLFAKNLELILLPGIELSSNIGDDSVHILGYNLDLTVNSFKVFLSDIQKKKRVRNLEILNKLKKNNIFITEDELYSSFNNEAETVIGRPHIAQLMVKKGFASNIQAGFDKYLADNSLCFVMGEKYDPRIVIEQIHQSKGKAVIAHPSQIKNNKVIHELLEMPFDGIEVYYSKLLLDQELKWLKIAKEKKMLVTGGSDFHGAIRPYVELGCSWIEREAYLKLIA